MGFGDSLKQLCQQAERAVVGHKDQIKGAIGSVGSVADKATKGRFSDTIAKASEKASSAFDKVVPDPAESDPKAADADGTTGATTGDGDAEATTAPEEQDPPSESA